MLRTEKERVPAHRRLEPVSRALVEGRVPYHWFGEGVPVRGRQPGPRHAHVQA